MKFGTRFKQLRETRGFSQKQVAYHLGMGQANYHKLESDKSNAKVEHLEKIALFYNISLAELVTDEHGLAHIQNNSYNHDEVAMSDPDFVLNLLNAKDELLKLKDQKHSMVGAATATKQQIQVNKKLKPILIQSQFSL
jgi:transcriptional regulator with XRE-family HTH domain